MGYKFTELADQDLQDISYHIALDNEKAAQCVYKSILDTCAMVADIPNMGRRPMYVDDQSILFVTVREFNRYLVFYRKHNDGVLILRVIHGSRDLPALFND
jgi:toxin ParE1/3/4